MVIMPRLHILPARPGHTAGAGEGKRHDEPEQPFGSDVDRIKQAFGGLISRLMIHDYLMGDLVLRPCAGTRRVLPREEESALLNLQPSGRQPVCKDRRASRGIGMRAKLIFASRM